MARPFSLQAVLRLRQYKEEAEERALAALGTQRQQVEATLARVHHELRQWTEDRQQGIGHASCGGEQHTSYARRRFLQDAQVQLNQQLETLAVQQREQQTAYLAARSARETLAELKQQQSDMEQGKAQRQEQRRLDDMFLGRWSR